MKHKHYHNVTPNANNPYINNSQNSNLFNSGNAQRDFIIGTLIGAAASFILTNENAQKALLKGFAKLSSLFEMGVEELKERYEDAKAEVNS